MRVISSGITDVGRKRAHNEDNFLINEEMRLFVVADGMGGHNGGEYASAICVNTVEEIVENMDYGDIQIEDAETSIELVQEKLSYALRLAGRRIYERAAESQEFHGMGTTAVALLLDKERAYVAHVGDSRLYLMRGDTVSQLTEDHSFVAKQVKAGVLTEEEAKNHRMRNVIYRSLGYQEDVEVDVMTVDIKSKDIFLLCSDGLSGHVEDREMYEHVMSHRPQDAARRMVDLACERGGDDNITVVVLAVEPSE